MAKVSNVLKLMEQEVDQGRFSDAAALFDKEPSRAPASAALLRGWILLKKRAYAETIRFLNSPKFNQLSKKENAQRFLLLAVANSRSNRFAEADEYFERASLESLEIVRSGELAYWQGRRYLEERRLDEAGRCLEEVRAVAGDQARIWGDWLQSGIFTLGGRYLDSALVLMHLLEFMDGLQRQHREDEIWALHTLATRARELDAPRIRRFVQMRVSRQEWTGDFRVNQFQTYKAVAWCHALEGDYFNAFRYLKMAGRIAPTNAWHAMTLLDRAYLATCIGESVWSRSELGEAQEIMEGVVWRQTADEERVALALAAELCAPVDAARAASYIAQFFEFRDALNPQLHLRYDERLSALGEYANGVVQSHLGNRKSASEAFRKAWTVYGSIGYNWRAGRCALRLFELSRNPLWYERARQKLENYSASWLFDEVRRDSRALPHVTPAQQRVLDLLVEGNTTEEIATSTGTSVQTIRHHVKALFRALGVSTRAALVSRAIRDGLSKSAKPISRSSTR